MDNEKEDVDEDRKKIARYLQDKCTLESNDRQDGLFTEQDLLILNVLQDNYKKWFDEKYGKDIKIDKNIIKVFTKKGQGEIFTDSQPLFYDKNGYFWLWNKDRYCWVMCDEVDLLNIIEKETGVDVISSKNRIEVLNTLKQEGRKRIPKPIKKTWVQFHDTIYDVIEGAWFNATPEYFVTNPLPYKTSMDEKTPTMDKLFEEWVGKEYVETLYQIIAFCTLPDYPINRLFCFVGAGMNGKSCYFNLIKKFIGNHNVTSTELDTLMTSRFEITKLHKKLVCFMGETDFNEMSKTSIIKRLTGNDLIGFEYKNKTPFDEMNYAKILIATNNLPMTNDKTIGFYRRWLIIDFPNQFTESKDILETIPEEEYNNLAIKSVIYLNDLLRKRSFTNEGSVEDRMKKFEDRSNPLEKFIKEYCDTNDPDSTIFKYDFEKKFNQWCKENRFRQFSDMLLGKNMKEKGFYQIQKSAPWLNENKGGQLRAWIGIKWKD